MYYFFMSALKDEETQKKGIVVIPYLLKVKSQYDGLLESPVHALKFLKNRTALPLRLGGFHFCANDLASRAFIALIRSITFAPRQDKIRMRVYTGKHP
jgi:hypothetical protein